MVSWANGPSPLDTNTEFGVRWTGEIEAQLSEPFQFVTYQRGGVRLWIDGEQRIYGWNGGRQEIATDPVRLRAGDRYPVQLDFHTTRGKPACSLMWESPTQERERIPTAFLYPAAIEVATEPDARPVTERIEAESCARVIGFQPREGGSIARGIGTTVDGVRDWNFATPGATLEFQRLDFGRGISTLQARARGHKNEEIPVTIEFRLDARDGETIATIAMKDRDFGIRITSCEAVTGVHDLYVVNTTGETWERVTLDWFSFE